MVRNHADNSIVPMYDARVTEAKRHPALRALIKSRVDPTVETGLLLTVSVVAVTASVSVVGALAEMIRTNRGLANYDLFFARWGANHATAYSSSGLKIISFLGGDPGSPSLRSRLRQSSTNVVLHVRYPLCS